LSQVLRDLLKYSIL